MTELSYVFCDKEFLVDPRTAGGEGGLQGKMRVIFSVTPVEAFRDN